MATSPRSRRTGAQRKGDANEQAILDTTAELLASAPLSDISVEAMVRGAGISRSSFYFYFGSKEEVLLALVDRTMSQLEAPIRAISEELADDPWAGMTAGIEATRRLWQDHGPILSAMAEAAAADPAIRAVWDATLQRFVDVNAEAIQAERDRGAASAGGPSPQELATALVWLSERAFHGHARGGEPHLADDRIVPVLTDIWMRAIYGTVEL